jgi:UDP-N-acetylmuramoylalanine--D-glutamate ligase
MMFSDEQLSRSRVVVMGLGRFGGGVGVTRFLAGRGARVLVTDLAAESALRDSIAALADVDVEYRLGEHVESDLDRADLLVVSPAVNRATSGFFQSAMARGLPWTTEMNLFLERCPAQMLGVTGSIGKSTTCAMLRAILEAPEAAASAGHRRTFLGGNIGESLLGALDDMTARDAVVLELSSFQLEAAAAVARSPHIAGITNIRPHHLDRHGDMASYLDAKLTLFRHQQPGDVALVGSDDVEPQCRVLALADARGARFVLAVHNGETYDLRVPGAHNQANAHLAVMMARAFGVAGEVAQRAIGRYAGLPHRLEWVGEVDGVSYHNDSKSTSAEAVTTALKAIERPVVLLCGGKDTGAELDRIVDSPWHNVRAVITFGDAANRLGDLIEAHVARSGSLRVARAQKMAAAVHLAKGLARAGDAVILSPGCPSYDEFVNYEHRGREFIALVKG